MHLPVMTESYLRKDFNFALYLGYCYGKVLTKFFKLSLWTMLLFFGVVILTNLVLEIMADTLIYGVFQLVFVIMAFIVLICMRGCLVNGQYKLTPHLLSARFDEEGKELIVMADPIDFDINLNKESVDVFEDHVKIPRMEYLDITEDNTTLNEE